METTDRTQCNWKDGLRAMSKKRKARKIRWSDEQMRQIMELRRSSGSAKHRNKKKYSRRTKFNRGEND